MNIISLTINLIPLAIITSCVVNNSYYCQENSDLESDQSPYVSEYLIGTTKDGLTLEKANIIAFTDWCKRNKDSFEYTGNRVYLDIYNKSDKKTNGSLYTIREVDKNGVELNRCSENSLDYNQQYSAAQNALGNETNIYLSGNPVDKKKVAGLLKYFNIKKDEFTTDNIVRYYPKNAPRYTNRNAVYCYVVTKDGVADELRFRFQYYNDDFLFIHSLQVNVDGTPYDMGISSWETDYGSGMVWEWCDDWIIGSQKDVLKAIANSKSTKFKMNGRQYYDTRTLTASQILDIKRSIELFEAFGGSF